MEAAAAAVAEFHDTRKREKKISTEKKTKKTNFLVRHTKTHA